MNTAAGNESGAMPSAGQYSLHSQVPNIQGTQVPRSVTCEHTTGRCNVLEHMHPLEEDDTDTGHRAAPAQSSACSNSNVRESLVF
jgi:hypothetical protein